MAFQKLQIRPGIVKDLTDYANTGGWFSSNHVRFNGGLPEKIGGWCSYAGTTTFYGFCTRLYRHFNLSSRRILSIGTTTNVYVELSGVSYDVTPVVESIASPDVELEAEIGESHILLNNASGWASVPTGGQIVISGAPAVGGIPASEINGQRFIERTAISNTIKIYTDTESTSNDTDTQCAVDILLQPGGAGTQGFGWGSDPWGSGSWGSGGVTPVGPSFNGIGIRTWDIDNYGEDLIMSSYRGAMYYWDATNPSDRMIPVQDLTFPNDDPSIEVPVIVGNTLVSDRDRHVFAFGCTPVGQSDDPDAFDPMLVRWSDQGNTLDWLPTDVNSSGFIRLSRGSQINSVIQTKMEVLVFTDESIHALRYIGAPFVFSEDILARSPVPLSPRSVAAIGDEVYWMGVGGFYRYAGSIDPIECPIRDFIYDGLNEESLVTVSSAVVQRENEIWWFYPRGSSFIPNAYVIFNYKDNLWSHGDMTRTAWVDNAVRRGNPIGAKYKIISDTHQDSQSMTDVGQSLIAQQNNRTELYEHEIGSDNGETSPPSAMMSWIESSPIEIGDGEDFVFLKKMLPDVTFRDYPNDASPTVDFELTAQDYPGGLIDQDQSRPTDRVQLQSADFFTEILYFRLRGRAFRLKVGSEETGIMWRLGSPRVDIKVDGRK